MLSTVDVELCSKKLDCAYLLIDTRLSIIQTLGHCASLVNISFYCLNHTHMESYPFKFNLLHMLLYNTDETRRHSAGTYGSLFLVA